MGKGSRNRHNRKANVGRSRIECYIEEYSNEEGVVSLRLRQKDTFIILELLDDPRADVSLDELATVAREGGFTEIFDSKSSLSYILVSGNVFSDKQKIYVANDSVRVVTLSTGSAPVVGTDRVSRKDWSSECEVYLRVFTPARMLNEYHYSRPQTVTDSDLGEESLSIFDDMVLRGTVPLDSVLHSVFIARTPRQLAEFQAEGL